MDTKHAPDAGTATGTDQLTIAAGSNSPPPPPAPAAAIAAADRAATKTNDSAADTVPPLAVASHRPGSGATARVASPPAAAVVRPHSRTALPRPGSRSHSDGQRIVPAANPAVRPSPSLTADLYRPYVPHYSSILPATATTTFSLAGTFFMDIRTDQNAADAIAASKAAEDVKHRARIDAQNERELAAAAESRASTRASRRGGGGGMRSPKPERPSSTASSNAAAAGAAGTGTGTATASANASRSGSAVGVRAPSAATLAATEARDREYERITRLAGAVSAAQSATIVDGESIGTNPERDAYRKRWIREEALMALLRHTETRFDTEFAGIGTAAAATPAVAAPLSGAQSTTNAGASNQLAATDSSPSVAADVSRTRNSAHLTRSIMERPIPFHIVQPATRPPSAAGAGSTAARISTPNAAGAATGEASAPNQTFITGIDVGAIAHPQLAVADTAASTVPVAPVPPPALPDDPLLIDTGIKELLSASNQKALIERTPPLPARVRRVWADITEATGSGIQFGLLLPKHAKPRESVHQYIQERTQQYVDAVKRRTHRLIWKRYFDTPASRAVIEHAFWYCVCYFFVPHAPQTPDDEVVPSSAAAVRASTSGTAVASTAPSTSHGARPASVPPTGAVPQTPLFATTPKPVPVAGDATARAAAGTSARADSRASSISTASTGSAAPSSAVSSARPAPPTSLELAARQRAALAASAAVAFQRGTVFDSSPATNELIASSAAVLPHLFSRLAESYVAFFFSLHMHSNHRDIFFRYYADGLAQTLYYCLCAAFPSSLPVLSDLPFRNALRRLTTIWITGHVTPGGGAGTSASGSAGAAVATLTVQHWGIPVRHLSDRALHAHRLLQTNAVANLLAGVPLVRHTARIGGAGGGGGGAELADAYIERMAGAIDQQVTTRQHRTIAAAAVAAAAAAAGGGFAPSVASHSHPTGTMPSTAGATAATASPRIGSPAGPGLTVLLDDELALAAAPNSPPATELWQFGTAQAASANRDSPLSRARSSVARSRAAGGRASAGGGGGEMSDADQVLVTFHFPHHHHHHMQEQQQHSQQQQQQQRSGSAVLAAAAGGGTRDTFSLDHGMVPAAHPSTVPMTAGHPPMNTANPQSAVGASPTMQNPFSLPLLDLSRVQTANTAHHTTLLSQAQQPQQTISHSARGNSSRARRPVYEPHLLSRNAHTHRTAGLDAPPAAIGTGAIAPFSHRPLQHVPTKPTAPAKHVTQPYAEYREIIKRQHQQQQAAAAYNQQFGSAISRASQRASAHSHSRSSFSDRATNAQSVASARRGAGAKSVDSTAAGGGDAASGPNTPHHHHHHHHRKPHDAAAAAGSSVPPPASGHGDSSTTDPTADPDAATGEDLLSESGTGQLPAPPPVVEDETDESARFVLTATHRDGLSPSHIRRMINHPHYQLTKARMEAAAGARSERARARQLQQARTRLVQNGRRTPVSQWEDEQERVKEWRIGGTPIAPPDTASGNRKASGRRRGGAGGDERKTRTADGSNPTDDDWDVDPADAPDEDDIAGGAASGLDPTTASVIAADAADDTTDDGSGDDNDNDESDLAAEEANRRDKAAAAGTGGGGASAAMAAVVRASEEHESWADEENARALLLKEMEKEQANERERTRGGSLLDREEDTKHDATTAVTGNHRLSATAYAHRMKKRGRLQPPTQRVLPARPTSGPTSDVVGSSGVGPPARPDEALVSSLLTGLSIRSDERNAIPRLVRKQRTNFSTGLLVDHWLARGSLGYRKVTKLVLPLSDTVPPLNGPPLEPVAVTTADGTPAPHPPATVIGPGGTGMSARSDLLVASNAMSARLRKVSEFGADQFAQSKSDSQSLNVQLKRRLLDRVSQLEKERDDAMDDAGRFTKPIVDRFSARKQHAATAAASKAPNSVFALAAHDQLLASRGEPPQTSASRSVAASQQAMISAMKREGRVSRKQRLAMLTARKQVVSTVVARASLTVNH